MEQLERGFLSRPGGVSIFYRWTLPPDAGPSTPCVLLVHGFGEHCGRYGHVAQRLVEAGYAVLRFDYRGHGQSSGPRGHVLHFDDYLNDLEGAHELLRRRFPSAPLFLLGHSQGGLITLLAVVERRFPNLAGAVVTSPFLGFALRVPFYKLVVGKAMSRVLPALSLPTGLDAALVCRVPAVVQAYRDDPLVHGVASSRWLTEVIAAHERVFAGAGQVVTPLLVLQAGDDRIVDPAATTRFVERLPKGIGSYRVHPDLYHEILNEDEGLDIVDAIAAWTDQNLPAPATR